jgi:CBS domain-containing protein
VAAQERPRAEFRARPRKNPRSNSRRLREEGVPRAKRAVGTTTVAAAVLHVIPPNQEATVKVRRVMTPAPSTCRLDTPLDDASRIMSEACCGTLIVLDHRGIPAGILTDRDLALEIGKSARHPSDVRASEAMTSPMYTCAADDSVSTALERMAEARIRRLPVLGEDGALVGIVSIDDILLWGVQHGRVAREELLRALRSIGAAHDRLLNTETLDDPVAARPGCE